MSAEATRRFDSTRMATSVRREARCGVRVTTAGVRGARVEVDKAVFTVGSDPSNDVVVADPTVSRHHLEVRVLAEGCRVVDLGSSNGTYLGTARVGEVTVTGETELQLGTSQLELDPFGGEVEVVASGRTRFGGVEGRSLVMRELFEQLEKVVESDCTVLLEGETGVGKEVVAESLHHESPRAAGPFVVVDCAALAGELMESELFGHVKGAFTGAQTTRKGLLEMASGGTVFLDEVGELPAALQVKLLGAIERRRVTPVGSTEMRPIDVRVVAATNRSLSGEVARGRFRADLYYRLSVVTLRVPPLRERVEDVPLLVERLSAQLGTPIVLSQMALARLAAQSWPGNVRELRNTVTRLALRMGAPAVHGEGQGEPFARTRDRFVADFERRYLLAALQASGENVSTAARQTGIERRYFQRLLRHYQIRAGVHEETAGGVLR